MELSLKELALSFSVPFLCDAAPGHWSRIQVDAASAAMYVPVNRSFHEWIQPCLKYQRQLWFNMLRAILKRKTCAEELKLLPTITPEEFLEAMNVVTSRERVDLSSP